MVLFTKIGQTRGGVDLGENSKIYFGYAEFEMKIRQMEVSRGQLNKGA